MNPTITIEVLKEFKELYNAYWRYIIYHGGRSSGKSYAVAQSLLIRGRQKKLRILCTREIQNTIKDSVHKLLSDLIELYGFSDYEITKDSVINRITGTEFIFKGLRLNSNEIKSTEGIDIAWVEEAQSVTKQSLSVLTPTIRKEGSQIIFTFNRFKELDPVYAEFVLHPTEHTYIRKVNYDTLEANGLLPDVIKLEIEKDKPHKEVYNHIWLGEPISQSDKAILNRDEVLEAMQRSVSDEGAEIIGVDVARQGKDRTVIFKRKGLKVIDWQFYDKTSVDETVMYISKMANKEIEIRVDDSGVGGGVTDLLKLQGYNVIPVNFGSKAQDPDRYNNWISEAWFHLAEIMEDIEIPMNDDLLMELTTRDWAMDMKGRRIVESKDKYKAKGFSSPDLADALIICFSAVVQKQYRLRTI